MSMIENPNDFNFQDWVNKGHSIYEDWADSTKAVYDPDVPGIPMFEENAFKSEFTPEYLDTKYQAHIDAGGKPEEYLHSTIGEQRGLHFKNLMNKHSFDLLFAERTGKVSKEDAARWRDVSQVMMGGTNPRWGENKGDRPVYFGEGENQSLISPFELMEWGKDKYDPTATGLGSMDDKMFWFSGKGNTFLDLLHPYKEDFEYFPDK
jgi:hypothetical protein